MNDLGGPAPIVAVGLSALTSRCALVNGLQSLPQRSLAHTLMRGENDPSSVAHLHRAPTCEGNAPSATDIVPLKG